MRALLIPAFFLLAAASQAQELVVNGGFESGDFAPGWTRFGSRDLFGVDGADEYEGNFGAYFGGSTLGITQTLTTVPGTSYEISFALRNVTGNRNSFESTFGDQSLLSLSNTPEGDYALYTFTKTATSASTPITFTFRHDVTYFELDAVSVRPSNPVPEPATLAALGLGAAAMLRRRRKS